MSKQAAKGNKSVVEAKQQGLHGFQDKQIADQIVEAHKQDGSAKTHAEAKAKAALKVCRIASKLRIDDEINSKLTAEDWASQWRKSVQGVLPRLHAAGIDWVEQTERKLKDGTTQVGYKMSGYGRNISSDANQTGQYSIDARKCDSLMDVRKAIKVAKQAEAEAAETDQEKELRELSELYHQGIDALTALLVEAESAEAWQTAIDQLAEMVEANSMEVPEIEVSETPEVMAAA